MSRNGNAINDGAFRKIRLSEFLEIAGELDRGQRETLLDQALILIEDLYVHLPLKRAMHAVDPVQRLKLLRRKLDVLTERQFHNEMQSIFIELRDLHTNYILPEPYRSHTAFLPFMIEEYYDDDRRHYLATKFFGDIPDRNFTDGVEITHWSGVPIDRAVEIVADREAGSNEAARHVRGLDRMTLRPMMMSLPPDEEWVMVGYIDANGQERETRFDWVVFGPEPEGAAGGADAAWDDDAIAESMFAGVDVLAEATNQAKKLLFAKGWADAATDEADGERSFFPSVFKFKSVDTPSGEFGYVRIFTFSLDTRRFILELRRILGLLPQNGVIIDVRGNGGGIITSGEQMLQLFTDHEVEAERLHFINSPLTRELCSLHPFIREWERSIELSLQTGAVYSQGYYIESPATTNAIGRVYPGPSLVITDARCYSTTDIFAAGYQDNGIGPILGVDENTGAGGANVWTHGLLRQLMARVPDSPFEALPNGADMRVSIRRTTRVGGNAGLPVEDLGVTPTRLRRITKNDLFNENEDLINAAAEMLAAL